MKTPLFLLLACMAAARLVSAAPQMWESEAEFFTSGDFDGDGRTDSVIIDKEAGVMRIGFQTAVETWTWAPARAAGAIPVRAAAVGKFLSSTRDSIAVTSPETNRVLVHPATSPTSVGTPLAMFELVGPDALAPIPLINSGGTAGRDQLMVGSALDPSAAPYFLAGVEPGVGLLYVAPEQLPFKNGQPIVLQTGTNPNAAFLTDVAGSMEIHIFNDVPANPPTLVSGDIATGSKFASANFNTASTMAQVIFWVPGSPVLRVRPVEFAAGLYSLGLETSFSPAGNITQIVLLNDPAGPRLLIIFDEGSSASIYAFNGVSAPVLVSSLTPASGEKFRAATLMGGGGFVLASSSASSKRSQTFRPYRRASASNYTALASASLPGVSTNSGRANVLLFAGAPFINESARPLAALHAGDWTRSISLAGGSVNATSETFASSSAGLDNPTVYNLGPVVAGANEVLANQFESYLSVSSLRAVYDTPDLEPAIAPNPGSFDIAQQLSFSAPAGLTIYFRRGNAGSWELWAGTPAWLTEDTTISYYGTDGVRNSSLRTAVYSFEKTDALLDSDHDGVPDFVEIARGLNPLAGPDTDGDSWTDQTELLAGTNPADPNDPARPAPPAILDMPARAANAGVDLTATLRSWRSGGPDATLLPVAGTRLDAIDTAGALLATRSFALGSDQVTMENLAVPRGTNFISLTTPASWQRNDGVETTQASQSIAVVPAPPPAAALDIQYTPGGGTAAAEADAWIAALAAAEAAQTPRVVTATLSPIDTLVALLLEKKIDDILISRGADSGAPFSMFNTGLTDAGARRVTPAQLAALELPGPSQQPAWRLKEILTLFDDALKASPGSAEIQALRALAADIFEQFDIAWLPPGEANPNGVTASFPAPIDLLRSVIRGGALPQGYLDVSVLTPGQIADAQNAISEILALPSPRSMIVILLTVLPNSFGADCTVLDSAGTTVSLVDHEGRAWRFRGSVALPECAEIFVAAFTDLPTPACAAYALEVVTATVVTLPGGVITDTDGDGLGDEWEQVFFGNLAQNGGGDFDGDGIVNSQEFADGTDPAGSASGGPGLGPQPLGLPVPEPSITVNSIGKLELEWTCSEECRRTLVYTLECNSTLQGSWQPVATSPEFLPDGSMRFTILPEQPGRCFFRIRVTQP